MTRDADLAADGGPFTVRRVWNTAFMYQSQDVNDAPGANQLCNSLFNIELRLSFTRNITYRRSISAGDLPPDISNTSAGQAPNGGVGALNKARLSERTTTKREVGLKVKLPN